MLELATRFSRIFSGLSSAHGTYSLEGIPVVEGSKRKGRACTVREPVTLDLWTKHLTGEQSLGIVPIREDGTCSWGCIDIDIYTLDIPELVEQVRKFELPLVPCRTKSGGIHLFLFTSEPVPAAAMQVKLREMAAALGFGRSEIFPKQGQVLADKGDVGNWLNMPYFEGEKTHRYAMMSGRSRLNMAEFLSLVERCSVSAEEFSKLGVTPPKISGKAVQSKTETTHPLYGGPPCLQTLAEQGVPEGTRNNGLYNFGVFVKKKFPDAWEAVLDQFNHDYMDPPLGSDEVRLVITTLKKKEYLYKCNDQPLCGFCNAALCRTRKFGIGTSNAVPIFSSLSKLNVEPPLWFLDVEGARLELTTDQLQNQRAFQKVCMERLNLVPPPVKDGQWFSILQDLMDNLMLIEAPKEVGTEGLFLELLEEFLAEADIKSLDKEELLLGRPWYDDTEKRVYFRLKDLQAYLERNNFKDFTRGKITTRVRALGGEASFFHIRGRGVNVWWAPPFHGQKENFSIPDMNTLPM